MEALTAFITSPSLFSLVFVLLVLGLLYFAAKKGLISYNAHGVKLGDGGERRLITNQWTYAKALCDSMYNKIRPFCDNDYHALYLIACVEDVFQDIVTHNHISTDDVYIRCKQQLVYSTILKRATHQHFQSPEFHQCCDKFVRELLVDLYSMKQIMS